MANYFYRVRNSEDKIIQGYINANSISDAAMKLEHKHYIVLEIKEESDIRDKTVSGYQFSKSTPLSLKEQKELFNSIYFLYKSGLSILEIFKSIINSSKNIKIKFLCNQIALKIEKGSALQEALEPYTKVIGLVNCALITSGEKSGRLEEVLSGILSHIKKQEEIKKELISKLTYPVIIFLLAIAVGLFFEFFVLKVFASIGSGQLTYCAIVKLLIFALIKIFIIVGIIVFIGYKLFKNAKLVSSIVQKIIGLKIFKNLVTYYYFFNFFLVFSLAFSSGLALSDGMHLARSVVHLPDISNKLKKAEKMVYQGCEIATALAVTGLFSDYAISQTSAGEKSGELDKMLEDVALDYQQQLETAINVLLKLVEPLTLILIGVFVAYIVIKAYNSYFSSFFSMF